MSRSPERVTVGRIVSAGFGMGGGVMPPVTLTVTLVAAAVSSRYSLYAHTRKVPGWAKLTFNERLKVGSVPWTASARSEAARWGH